MENILETKMEILLEKVDVRFSMYEKVILWYLELSYWKYVYKI